MKNMKKVLAIVLAAAMVMAMSLTAFADDTTTNAYDTATVTVSGLTSGDTLKLYKVFTATVGADNTITYTAEDWVPDEYDTVAEITAADTTTVANALAAAAKANSAAAAYSATADGDLSVAAGYYVANVEGTSAEVVYQNMLINAVMTANSSNSYDAAKVTATIKSTKVEVDKDVTGAADDSDTTDAYKVGDYVPFTVTTAIPNYPSNSTYATFVISDSPTNLEIVNDDDHKVTVTVGGNAVTAADGTYSLDVTDGALTITFAKDYILDNTGATVVVTYSAKVTDAAATAETKNNVKVTYNPNPYVNTTNDVEDIVTVNTYGYVFNKTDGTNPLEGATFTLYSDEACTTPVTTADGTTAMTSTSTKAGNPELAYVYFNGLAAGTYYVKETTVPAGYVGCDNFSFNVSSTTATADNPATTDVTETNYLVNTNAVVNTPGAELPTTGGIGTTIFYVVGAILVIGAGVVLVTRRRMSF